jgi:hypothetical protein
MWKGIEPVDVEEFGDVSASSWVKNVDAEKRGQFAGLVSDEGGLMRYLALHFQKESQQPPKGWRGHRFRAMKGYLAQPMADAREEARQSLRFKRELRRAIDAGMTGEAAEEAAHLALYEANETAWTLVRLQQIPTTFTEGDVPSGWKTATTPVRS